MLHVAILIFDQIEVLDFAGPYEVFNVTAELNQPTPFNVFTVAESLAPIRSRGQLSINPNYSIYAMPKADILVIPGGSGSRALLNKPHLIEWLQAQMTSVQYLLSVCTGALVLAKAGLLDGMQTTTHHGNLDELAALLKPNAEILSDKRYLDNGKILMSGGISAGIDLSLYLVKKLLGNAALAKTLDEMEYPWDDSLSLSWPESIQQLGTNDANS